MRRFFDRRSVCTDGTTLYCICSYHESPSHIKNTRLYISNKGEGESESREKRIEPIHNTNDSDERAHTLWCYSSEQSADELNIDIQWSKR